ncbi:unnamed protein product, partial [marine sediment metagenome]
LGMPLWTLAILALMLVVWVLINCVGPRLLPPVAG